MMITSTKYTTFHHSINPISQAIKYHLWTSTPDSNMKLKTAWEDAHNKSKEKPNKVYLIFR